ncbi:hypothetical protein O7635_30730 [Asanoa sp. WMMD1127]|uniref:hypothetical protein n=1 Tax=Asanoa sp. WMMD1127 TaxID=3016107 RepID=UPI0024166D61|nr:hypothetical protein [Asanoa sp. WMMD1127]MDG4826247.1 hypothetical protein [Asanoa sp. WMMD1127]
MRADDQQQVAAGGAGVLVRHLRAYRDAVDVRIRALEAAREMLDHAARCPVEDLTACPSFRAAVTRPRVGPWRGR